VKDYEVSIFDILKLYIEIITMTESKIKTIREKREIQTTKYFLSFPEDYTKSFLKDNGVRLHNFTKYKKEWFHYQIEYRNLKM